MSAADLRTAANAATPACSGAVGVVIAPANAPDELTPWSDAMSVEHRAGELATATCLSSREASAVLAAATPKEI